jgi:hypothetical protein
MASVGTSVGPPRKDFFVRNDPNDLNPEGPLTFAEAMTHARFISKQEDNVSGTAEVITFIGSRPSDPPNKPPVLQTVFLFVRGRLLFGGRVAAFNSKKFVGLPIGSIQ